MARHLRRGFTLVEMLVVITIMAMLVALLIPAALSVQGMARRATCLNNLKEITTACLKFEGRNGRMPPQFYYEIDRAGTTTSAVEETVSWVVTILEDMDKGDLGGALRDKKLLSRAGVVQFPWDTATVIAAKTAVGKAYVSQLVCPANPPGNMSRAALGYVCNAGRQDSGVFPSNATNDYKENGVFMNFIQNNYPGTQPNGSPIVPANEKVTLNFISSHDGTGTTLLASENVNATIWAIDMTLNTISPLQKSLAPSQFDCTMLWSPFGTDIQGQTPVRVSDPNDEIYYVVTGANQPVGIKAAGNSTTCRPSSFHGGGYHASFCDGKVLWLSDNMDKGIYPLLMTPWGGHVRDPANGSVGLQKRAGSADFFPAIINELELAR